MVTEHDRQRLCRHHPAKAHEPGVTKAMIPVQQCGDASVQAGQQIRQREFRPMQTTQSAPIAAIATAVRERSAVFMVPMM